MSLIVFGKFDGLSPKKIPNRMVHKFANQINEVIYQGKAEYKKKSNP